MKLLPDRDAFFYRYIHRIFLRNAKCIIPCSNVRQRSVYTPFAQRVYIDLRQLQDGFGTGIVSPNIGISQEEALFGSETVFYFQRSGSGSLLECLIRYLQTSVVGDILTQRKTSVGMKRIYYDCLLYTSDAADEL